MEEIARQERLSKAKSKKRKVDPACRKENSGRIGKDPIREKKRNTSLAAPGALAHCLQRRTAFNAATPTTPQRLQNGFNIGFNIGLNIRFNIGFNIAKSKMAARGPQNGRRGLHSFYEKRSRRRRKKKVKKSENTSLAAPGALAHCLQRRTACNTAEANLHSPNKKTEVTSL